MRKSLGWRANGEEHVLRNLEWSPHSEIVLLMVREEVGDSVPN